MALLIDVSSKHLPVWLKRAFVCVMILLPAITVCIHSYRHVQPTGSQFGKSSINLVGSVTNKEANGNIVMFFGFQLLIIPKRINYVYLQFCFKEMYLNLIVFGHSFCKEGLRDTERWE